MSEAQGGGGMSDVIERLAVVRLELLRLDRPVSANEVWDAIIEIKRLRGEIRGLTRGLAAAGRAT